MTKVEIKSIHEDINKAMNEIAEKYGMIYTPSTLRYSDADCKVQVHLVKERTNSVKSEGYDKIKTGFGRPGDKAVVVIRGKRQEVLITKNPGRGRYQFQTEEGNLMKGPYSLFSQA